MSQRCQNPPPAVQNKVERRPRGLPQSRQLTAALCHRLGEHSETQIDVGRHALSRQKLDRKVPSALVVVVTHHRNEAAHTLGGIL
jgi:hypothetical protein